MRISIVSALRQNDAVVKNTLRRPTLDSPTENSFSLFCLIQTAARLHNPRSLWKSLGSWHESESHVNATARQTCQPSEMIKTSCQSELQVKQSGNAFGWGGNEIDYLKDIRSPTFVCFSVCSTSYFIWDWFGMSGGQKQKYTAAVGAFRLQLWDVPLPSTQKHSNQPPAERLKCIRLFS